MKTIIQLNSDAIRFREKAGYGNREPIDIESIVLKMNNYTIVKMKMSNHISGMCIVDGTSKMIAINSSMSLGRQRFTIGHELYHLEIENLTEGKVCPSGIYDNRSDNEKEADIFASFLLMPYDGLEWYIDNYQIREWNIRNVIELSQFYKMSYMAILFRLYHEGRITFEEYEYFKKVNVKTEAIKLGYDISLYGNLTEEHDWITLGEYPRLLEEQRGLIPESLFHQFCRDGFREDMKNENIEEGAVLND